MTVRIAASLHPEARLAISEAAAAAAPRETGGLLLGWWDAGRVIVRHAIEVRDPAATTNSWIRHQAIAQYVLDQAMAALSHPWIGYVGDWHSHTAPRGASQQDLQTIRNASRGYPEPILLVVHRSDDQLDIRAALRGNLRPTMINMADVQDDGGRLTTVLRQEGLPRSCA